MIPTIDPGGFVPAVKRGRIEVVPGVSAFEGRDVVLDGDERIAVDAVVAATGYRKDLEPLVGHLGVLDAEGDPLAAGPRTVPAAPGLYFIGFTNVLAGNLRQIRLDAKAIAAAAARDS